MFIALKQHLNLTFTELQVADAPLAAALIAALAAREVTYDAKAVIGTIPEVGQLIEEARLEAVVGLSALSETGQAALLALGSLGAVTDEELGKLGLSGDDAARVGKMVERFLICEDSVALVTVINTIGDGATNGELAARTPGFWETALAPYDKDLPAGTSVAAVSEVLARRLEILYPVCGVLGRIPTIVESQQKTALDALVVLEERNPRRFDGTFEDLILDGAPSSEHAALKVHWNLLLRTIRGYPGLGISELFDDTSLMTGQRFNELTARVNSFISALSSAAGPSFRADPLALDLREGSEHWARFNLGAHGALIKAAARGYQRMRVVGKNIDVAATLLAAGYSSALSIARKPVTAIQALPGLAGTKGEQIWETARQLGTDAALFVAGIADQVGGAFDPAPTRPVDSVGQSFTTLEGYASLFGSQSYCDCAHCASILGPAAYFVDLMQFVKEEVGGQLPVGDRLTLKARRPDLWTLPLTCSATTALIPTLTIVNEVLENVLAGSTNYIGAYDDRVAVEAWVYQGASGLPGATRSFAQPFAVGLAQTSAQLSAFGIDRPALAEAVGASDAQRLQVTLGVTSAWESLITTPRTTIAAVSEVYGVGFVETPTAIAHVDATVLAAAMGLDRHGLGTVVDAWFVRQGGATPTIDPALRGPQSIQFDIEWVEGLTVDALDRMHRLTRLARVLGLPISQVDRLLRVQANATLTSLELASFADYRVLAARFGAALSEDAAASLAGPLDDVGLASFNRGVRDAAAAWPASAPFFHPGLVTSGVAAGGGAAVRLAAALGLTDSATLALIRYLAPHLAQESSAGFDPDAANEETRYFFLSTANLSLLDRHARLSRLLGVTVDELISIMALAGISHVTGFASAVSLANAVDAWRASGRSLDALVAATGGTPRNARTLLDVAVTAATIRSAAAAGALVADDVFAAAYGMSIEASRAVLADNAALFSVTAEGRRIADAVDLEAAVVVVPAGSEVVIGGVRRAMIAADVIALLAPHSARGQVVRGLATATGRDDDEVRQLVRLAGVPIDAAVAASVRDAASGGRLEVVVAAVSRIEVATRGWSAAGLAMLGDAPAIFGPGAWPAVNASLPQSPRFTFAQATALGRAAARGNDPARQDGLLAVAALFNNATSTFAPGADAALAAFLGTSPATIAGLRGTAALPPGVIAALDRLAALVHIADRLGVDGGALKGLVSDLDSERAAAAVAIEHAAELRAERDPAEATRLSDARGMLREQKRDALVDALLRAPAPTGFRDRGALSSYLLVDVDAGGCATTSRVVAATNAVQEYVTRITLGLERSELPPDAPGYVAVALSDAGTRSWEWRRAYRVWEANRKVFLWPENYLEPSIRDDKTPLFAELEDALAQGDLDEPSILAAYATYLHGLDELASLKIAGAYHDVGSDDDVLHLIGVTATDPATFYYRSVTDVASMVDLIARPAAPERGTVWGHWQKLDLASPSRYVSPVVHQGRLYLLWNGVKTRALQHLSGGGMTFVGYRHSYDVSMAVLQPQGTLSTAQKLALQRFGLVFDQGPGAFTEHVFSGVPEFSNDGASHGNEPMDGHTLEGASWQRVTPMVVSGALVVALRNHRLAARVDPFARSLSQASFVGGAPPPRPLIRVFTDSTEDQMPVGEIRCAAPEAWARHPELVASAISSTAVTRDYRRDQYNNPLKFPAYPDWRLLARATSVPDAMAIPGMLGATIVTVGSDLIAFYPWATPDTARYSAIRLGTTVVQGLSRQLFERGIDGVLSTAQQLALAESPLPLVVEGDAIVERSDAGTVNFRGAFGTYLRELFLHIPMLIATTLAGRGRHADARRWLHRVFDPTSTEQIDTAGVPTAEISHRQLDRVWRFRELRGLDADRARDILTDGAALAAYREDPFNPHAIARRRLTAYQRHAFARYVDNLLEWGDLLFAQFTRETVEEARALYQLAATLLGTRPARLGDCSPASSEPLDFGDLETQPSSADPIRIGAETEVMARGVALRSAPVFSAVPFVGTQERLAKALQRAPWATPETGSRPVSFGRQWLRGRTGAWAPTKAIGAVDGPLGLGGRVGAPARGVTDDTMASTLLAQLGPAFCVPVNKALLARWDRVEDRLWKIHHCRDITGERRELALFAPELDPMARVEATALGLRPDDLVADVAREVPPYRFAYLIERAKGFASSLSGFGGALLGALERRDNEALSVLRHQQGLAMARLTRQQREIDVQMAQEGLASLERQIASSEYRRDYQDSLLTAGLSIGEASSLGLQAQAAMFRTAGAKQYAVSAMAHSLPEVNAPFTVSTGGEHAGNASDGAANVLHTIAAMLDSGASMSGTLAGYARRSDGWSHQLQLIRDELASMANQRRAAVLRVTVAEQALVAYDESIQQLEDVLQFERDRVTNLALHTRLASGLKQLYRMAYGHALALARLAERAYHYERGDTGGGLASGYWDASMGGLLAGERLLSDLHALDRRFLETNHRELEIEQPFPLSQLDPVALLTLRETGACTFTVPEVAFDLAYPGHCKRRLRAVRLTIPCVTGPYVNVSATLTLLGSQVRPTATAALADVPLAHGTTIAASNAQADGGVFELSFRDERYLPFEGQGAVSTWELTLPQTVRSFDYATIADVILSLAYSARPDTARRVEVETGTGPSSLLAYHRAHGTQRAVSARHELGATFTRLVRSPVGTPVAFTLTEAMLPAVFRGRPVEVITEAPLVAGVIVRVGSGVNASGLVLEVDGIAVRSFSPSFVPDQDRLWFATAAWPVDQPWSGDHTITVTSAGVLAVDGEIDPDKLLDVVLMIPVRLAEPV